MSKPFNFEEFKAGKPAMLKGVKIEFIAYDEDFNYPVFCKETYENRPSKGLHQCSIKYLQDNATMLPTKRTVWIGICKHKHYGIRPSYVFYNSKDEALKQFYLEDWKVIDAIPYEIEE